MTKEGFISWILENQILIFRLVLILAFALLVYWAIEKFGRRAIGVALTKRKTALSFNHDVGLSKDDIQRIDTLSMIINKIGLWVMVLITGTTILSELQVNIGPILAGAGVMGVALGFGAQSLVKDFLSGIFILIENQYVKGDVVKLGEAKGKVVDISLRRTVLRDMSGAEHHVPNGEIKNVVNYTKDWANVNLSISVDYDSNIDHVTNVLNLVAEELANDDEWKVYIQTQPTVLGVDDLADSAIKIRLHGKVEADHQWSVQRELRKRIKIAFDKEKIIIPYPHIVNLTKK
ncbi:MAG: mechanosensitive ion channel family protein [bacterium]|nr:mechanosensitive ion channel family protein [bacterium]